MLERLKGVNIVIKCRSLVDWPRQIDPRTYFHTQNVAPFPASASWHLSRNKEEKSSNFSNTDFSLKIEQIKVVACGKLHFTESFLFFSLPHDKSATEPPPHPPPFRILHISLCLIISFQLHTMKDYDAAAARTAGSVPSKIFLLMLLTCTSVYTSA